ncbi:MAG: hypothetical protein EOO02_08150 [Chitinophagaceae bacterium]|nr:MAG: hypothetical protein EOO02_08150 [Chitinophagaceae bacterium]
MKSFILILFVLSGFCARAQKLESLNFNLYTDSLKKGTYNYINVDGKYDNGRYLPLTAKELIFNCADGKFEGNSLFLDPGFRKDSVTVKIFLKSDTTVNRSRVIYIKKFESTEGLKTMEEVMKPKGRHSLSSGR